MNRPELITREELQESSKAHKVNLEACVTIVSRYVSPSELPPDLVDEASRFEPIIVKGSEVMEITAQTPVVVQWINMATGKRELSMPLCQ